MSMPLDDAIFWIAITVFGAGLYLVPEYQVWGIALMVAGATGIIYSIRAHLRGANRSLWMAGLMVLTWVLVSYDIYDRRHRVEADRVLTSWGDAEATGQICQATVDGSRISEWKDKSRVAIACGIADSSIDWMNDERITVSRAFSIKDGSMKIVADYSAPMAAVLSGGLQKAANIKNKPKPLGIQWDQWVVAIVLPNDADILDVHRLSDVKRLGGTVLDPHTSLETSVLPGVTRK